MLTSDQINDTLTRLELLIKVTQGKSELEDMTITCQDAIKAIKQLRNQRNLMLKDPWT
jgi:hypothetical protein